MIIHKDKESGWSWGLKRKGGMVGNYYDNDHFNLFQCLWSMIKWRFTHSLGW